MRARVELWLGICLGLIHPAGGAGFAQTPRPTRSSAISVTADGSRVWVVNPDSDSVTVMETTGDSVVAEIPVGTRLCVAKANSNSGACP